MRCAGSVGMALGVVAVLSHATARAQTAPAGEAVAEARERGALLAQSLPEAVQRRSLWLAPPVLIASGGAMTALGGLLQSPLVVVGGAVTAAGGIAFYAMPEQRNYELLVATAEAGSGLFYLGLPLSRAQERWQIPVGAAYLATSALGFINFGYATNPGRTRLQHDLSRVRTPAARSGLTQEELQKIERDLYDTDPFVPQWAYGLPLMVGGIAASAPLFDRDGSSDDKLIAGLIAGATFVQGAAFSLSPTIADGYRTSLARAGLWAKWSLGPGGVSIVGGFD